MFIQFCSGSDTCEKSFSCLAVSRVSLSEKFTNTEVEGELNHTSTIPLYLVQVCESKKEAWASEQELRGLGSGSASSVILNESFTLLGE